MRKIIFTKTIDEGRRIAKNLAATKSLKTAVLCFRAERPKQVSDLRDGKIDVLVVPRQYIEGWYLRQADIEIEFSEDFPKDDAIRALAAGIVRKVA